MTDRLLRCPWHKSLLVIMLVAAFSTSGLPAQKGNLPNSASAQTTTPKPKGEDPKREAGIYAERSVEAIAEKNYDEAAQFLEKAVRLNPSSDFLRMNLASAYAMQVVPGSTDPKNQEKAQKAIDILKPFAAKGKVYAQEMLELGRLNYQIKRYDEARNWCHKALKIDPQDYDANYLIGVITLDEVSAKTGNQGKNIKLLSADEKGGLQIKIDEALGCIDKVLKMDGEFLEAIEYQSLLLREKAKLSPNESARSELMRQADLTAQLKARKEEAKKAHVEVWSKTAEVIFNDWPGDSEVPAIYSANTDGSNLRQIGRGISPQFSPDKTMLTYLAPNEERTIGVMIGFDSAGKETFRINAGDTGLDYIAKYTWNPDSKSIAFVAIHYVIHRYAAGSVEIFNVETKQTKMLYRFKIRQDPNSVAAGISLEWDRSGEKLLFSPGAIPFGEKAAGDGVFLIDRHTVGARNLSSNGKYPTFNGNMVIYFVNSELWSMDLEGNEKIRLADTGVQICTASTMAGGIMIFQGMLNNESLGLFIYDAARNEIELLKMKGGSLFCPVLSPDGSKFTAVGAMTSAMRWAQDSSSVERELDYGYYTYEIGTGEITRLRKFAKDPEGESFGMGTLFGIGNYTSW